MNLAQILSENEEFGFECTETSDIKKQINTLHTESDGYITLCITDKEHRFTEESEPTWKQYHFKPFELISKLDNIKSLNTNTYISVNSFYIAKRSINTLRYINALYTDIDCCIKGYQITDDEINYAINILQQEYFNRRIPEPTMIIKSGRGLHLYWKIENLPKQGLPYWSVVQKAIFEELKDFNMYFNILKVDPNAMDCTRVLRLVGTINTKNNAVCTLEDVYEENNYTLDKIVEKYFPDIKIIKNKSKKNKTVKEKKFEYLHNAHTLHWSRYEDIKTLQQLRNGECDGMREDMCFLYRYYSCLYNKDTEMALQDTLEFNSNFTNPLTVSEVINNTKSAEKAFKAWEKTLNNKWEKWDWGKDSKKSEFNGYNYKTPTLVYKLKITVEEQEHLKNLIGPGIKSTRQNEDRKEKRRNENGLTAREQQKQDLIDKVKKLKQKYPKQKDIAQKLGISEGTVSKYLRL